MTLLFKLQLLSISVALVQSKLITKKLEYLKISSTVIT